MNWSVRGGAARRLALVAALLAPLLCGLGAAAQSPDVPDPLLGLRIDEALEAGDANRAVAIIDAELAQAADFRLRADLLRRKADILEAEGRHAEAAAARETLAGEIVARDGANAPALIPVLDAAARAYAAAGDIERSVATLQRLLEIHGALKLGEAGEVFVARLQEAVEAVPELRAEALAAIGGFRQAIETERSIFGVDPEEGFSTVRIYYATDRARTGDSDPNSFYGGDRGELELGTAEVSIPPRHMPGRIERPSFWTFEFREDPAKHVVLKSVTPGDSEAVFGQMRGQLAETGGDSAFVFIHGFNVPFNEAAQRTAQMAYDMNFEGLPILYSWPSRASLLSYIADTAVVNLSGRRLTLFLEDVVRKSGATRIHLIGHSMGNRALTDALELYALRHEGEPPAFDQVLFTAPDLDAGLFAEMAKTMRKAAQRLTLYASDKDWALAVSRKLHGDSARAGQGGRHIVHSAEVDSIDMTTIGEDMLMHSYYANNPSALTDILSLFWRDAPPEDRCGMMPASGEAGSYWEYLPDQCDSNALLSTLSMLQSSTVVSFNEARQLLRDTILPTTTDPEERSRLENALAKLFSN